MPLPRLVTPEDIEKIVNYLRFKPTGSQIKDMISPVGKPVMRDVRVALYLDWGFVKRDGDVLSITDLGRRFSTAEEPGKQEMFAKIIRRYDLYLHTLEYFHFQDIESILTADLASYWVNNSDGTVSTKNTRALNEQVVCFGRLLTAAGLGKITLGRGKRATNSRVELFRDRLQTFVTGADEPTEMAANVDVAESTDASDSADSATTQAASQAFAKPSLPPDPIQSLHINVQVQITAEVTPDQIDQIFKSMATHLYGRDGDQN